MAESDAAGPEAPEGYRFGPFRFECATGRLYRDGEEVSLPPRASVLLEHLLAHAGEVCGKQELMDLVWADVHVGEESLTQAISLIRQALDDDARRPTWVETIQRRGYRFIGEVERQEPDPTTDEQERPFGIYEVVERVGVGGMGRVYRARDRRLDRDVALKVLPAELLDDDTARRRFEREARLLAALNHPAIATLHALEESREQQFLVMELVDGETLARRLRSGPLEVAEALGVCRQVAEALEAAHARGIVHRDLKPANVMITGDDRVKVLDFGVAKALDLAGSEPSTRRSTPLTETGLAVGTPPYMSPEQVQGEDVDGRADLWALGCLLYETLAGRKAFDADTPASTTAAILGEEPDWGALPEAVPPRVRLLLERLLRKDPRQRLHHAADARIEIDEALAETSRPGRVAGARSRPAGGSGSSASAGGPAGSSAAAHGLPDAAAGRASHPTDGPAPPRPGAATADGAGDLTLSRRQVVAGGAAAGVAGVGAGIGLGTLIGDGSAAADTASDGTPATSAPPTYQRLTFRRGMIRTARFGPDHQTVLYGALWEGDVCRIYRVRPESPESGEMGLPAATPLAVSGSGQMALALGTQFRGIMPYGTLARVPLAGGVPRELAEEVKYADWSPDGRELAVVRRVEGRERLEFPLGEVVAEPSSAGGGFSFPRVSPRGDRVAFFELTSAGNLVGSVATVDRRGNKEIVSTQHFNVFGLAWNGDEIWFTAAAERPLFRNTIWALRAGATEGTARVVARIPGNASLHDISPDGRVLLARTDDRSGITVLAPGETQERDLSWLDASRLADISRDGSTILFTEHGVGGGPDRSIYLRATTGSPAVLLGTGTALALSPDARWAITREYSPGVPDDHLDVIPTGPGETRRIQHAGFTYTNAGWLPDGERVVVRAREGDRELRFYLQEVDGDAIDAITPEGLAESSAALSPDGTTLAVVSDRGLELYPVEGGEPRTAPDPPAEAGLVGWIEGGLLFSDDSDERGPDRIFRVDPISGERELWREIQPRDPAGIMAVNRLQVAPDGSSYGYSWHRALSDLYLVEGLH